MNRSELEDERDQLAVHISNTDRQRDGFKSGFDAGVKAMLEREEVLREALRSIAYYRDYYDSRDATNMSERAIEALEQVPEIEELNK